MASSGHARIRVTLEGYHLQPNPYRPTLPGTDIEMEVVIDYMDESGEGGGVASFLTGYVMYRGEKLSFEAVAYGRIGGQNVSPTLSTEALGKLEKLGMDPEAFTASLQRKLVEGEITLKVSDELPRPE